MSIPKTLLVRGGRLWQYRVLTRHSTRACTRFHTTTTSVHNASWASGTSWTTGRALLFSALASSLAYVYGVTNADSNLNASWKKDKMPQYGTAKDLEKVSISATHNLKMSLSLSQYRQLVNSASLSAKTPSALMMTTFMLMASLNGHP